jgi:DNA repair protein SbcD/Mre11
MRLLHLSDLHLGKRVNEFSMLEDQKYILKEIIRVIDAQKPDGILIAGDIYDKSTPGEEAVRLLDDFLTRLAKRKLPVFIISGNHDSAVKLSFASGLIDQSGIHFAPAYAGEITPYHLGEGEDEVCIYMLPFVKPATVRSVFPGEKIENYTDAVRVAIEHMQLDPKKCNILVAHQFVTGAKRCESEEVSVGGLDQVDAGVFQDFAYVALGHIHGPQQVGRETIRYCGTPLKYSFSESNQQKSVTVVDITKEEGEPKVQINTVPLIPLHDLRQLRGDYASVTDRRNYEQTATEDYLQITLTDEEDIPDAMAKLRIIYPNLMLLRYDNQRTRETQDITGSAEVGTKSPLELVEEFYEIQNNQPMRQEQQKLVEELIEKIWEGDGE